MEIKFQAHCQYTLQDIILIKSFGTKRLRRTVQFGIFFIFIIPSLLLYLMDGYLPFKESMLKGVIGIIIISIMPYVLVPIQVRTTKNKMLINYTVTFYENHLIVAYGSKDKEFEYKKSMKFGLKQNKIYIRIAPTYLLIKKEEFVIGTADSFIEFMKIVTKAL